MRRIVLILTLIFFSAPTRGEAPAIDVNQAAPGGLYFATEKPGMVVPTPVLQTDVRISVTGPIVRTRVEQAFTNTGTAWVEGLYTYPLPKGSAVDTLEMRIGERVIKGEIQEKAQAKKTYETAKRAGKRASLVVQRRPNIFSTRLANIGPGETIRVAIEFQDLIEPRDNRFELRFPMVVRPRYSPGQPLDDRIARAGWGFDTDQVRDGSTISQPLIADPGGRHNPVTLTLILAAGFELAEIMSPSHAVDIHRAQRSATVTLADDTVPSDQDFILRWQPVPSDAPSIGLFTETTDKGVHHLMMLMPPTSDTAPERERQPRELVIVLDKSGSMGGQAIRQAKAAVRRALLRLKANDSFNLIAFDSTPTPLFSSPRPASDRHVEDALDFLDNVEAGGGTEMSAALDHALPLAPAAGATASPESEDTTNRLRQIIFVTDGAVGNEAALMAQIKARLGSARLFTVGIGSAPNSYFMEEAAHFGRGTYVNIAMNDDMRTAMAGLFRTIERPQLTDIAIDWPEGAEKAKDAMVPARIADLYDGEPIIVAFRSDTAISGPISVRGSRAGSPWQAPIPLAQASKGTGIAGLWSRRSIKAINRAHIGRHSQADREARRAAILKLALDYHLVSDFTSLVAVEHEPVRQSDDTLYGREVPANLPAGMDWADRRANRAVFTLSGGRVQRAERRAMASVRTRATATPMQAYLLAGGLLLLASLSVFALTRRRSSC